MWVCVCAEPVACISTAGERRPSAGGGLILGEEGGWLSSERAERTPVPMHSYTFLISRWMKERGVGHIEKFHRERRKIMPLPRVGENAFSVFSLVNPKHRVQRGCSVHVINQCAQLRALNASAATGNRLI